MLWRCSECFRLHFLPPDILKLESRSLSNMVTARGFECSCGHWESVIYLTESLEKNLNRLANTPVSHGKFRYFFGDALKKTRNVRHKAENGDLSRKNMALP